MISRMMLNMWDMADMRQGIEPSRISTSADRVTIEPALTSRIDMSVWTYDVGEGITRKTSVL